MHVPALMVLTLLAAGAGGIPAAIAADAADESPKDIIAAQLRAQGYACDQPQSAEQDE